MKMARKRKFKALWPKFDQEWPHDSWPDEGTKKEQTEWRTTRDRWFRQRAEFQLVEATQRLIDRGYLVTNVCGTLAIYRASVSCGSWDVSSNCGGNHNQDIRFQCDAQLVILDVFAAGHDSGGV